MTDTERYYSLQSLFINNPHSMNEKALKEYRDLIDIHDKDLLRAKEHKERIKFLLQMKEHQKKERAKYDEKISQASKRYQELKSEWAEKGIVQNPDSLTFYKDGKEFYYPKSRQLLTMVREMEAINKGLKE